MAIFRKHANQRNGKTQLSAIKDDTGQLIGTLHLAQELKPDAKYPDLVYFTLHYGPAPLPEGDDWDRFNTVHLKLEELAATLDFFEAAVMTIQGKRDWMLYVRDGQVLMKQLSQELGEYEPKMECQRDPKWSQYMDLLRM